MTLISFTMFLSYNLLKSTGGGGIMATILFIQMIFMFFTLMMLVGFIMQILVRPKRLITAFLPILVAFFFLFIGFFMNFKISLVYLYSLLQNILVILPYILGMLIIEYLYYPSGLTPGERGIFTSSSLPKKVKRFSRKILSEPEPMLKVSEDSEIVEKVEVEKKAPEESSSAILKKSSVQVAPTKDEEVERLVFEDPTSTLEEEVVEDVKRSFRDEENKISKADRKVYDQMKVGFTETKRGGDRDDEDSDQGKFEELDEIVNELEEEIQEDPEEENQAQEEVEESEEEGILFLDDVLEESEKVEEVEEEPLVHGVSLEELDEIEEEKRPEQIYEQVEEWQREKTEVVQDFISKEESDGRKIYNERMKKARRFLESEFAEGEVVKMDDFYQEMGAETVEVDNYLKELEEERFIFLVGTNIVKRG